MDEALAKPMQRDFARRPCSNVAGRDKTRRLEIRHFESPFALYFPNSNLASRSTSSRPSTSTYCKMIAMGRRTVVVVGIVGATLCFSLGWLASRVVQPSNREPMATPSSEPVSLDGDAGALGPLLLIDPSKVTLLPDASLNFDLPAPLDVPGQTGAGSR